MNAFLACLFSPRSSRAESREGERVGERANQPCPVHDPVNLRRALIERNVTNAERERGEVRQLSGK
jgi:hypothetical protein